MPKLTIDGEELEVPAGTTVLQAALGRGVEIPHYCWHPALSVAGNCRMCLVEVEKAPKLQIACATPVTDGMVVHTRNDRVRQAQTSVLEFLLINHPLDCPICDQAGECKLQDYAVSHGPGKSRYTEPKLALAKAVDIGPHVLLDQERCIQCSRCTRFCDEVTKTGELAFFQRGERAQIGIWPGRPLDNLYSGNVVDLCPVGALTLKEFRFATRVWYLKNTPSICAGCARGCNVVVAVGTQQVDMTTRGQLDDRVKRIVPRANERVNGHWICDIGRLSYQPMQAVPRLPTALSAGTPAEWDAIVERVAAALREAAAAGRAGALFSPRLTLETLFAWKRLLSSLGTVRAGVRSLVRGEDDDLLLRADKGANSRGAEWIFGRAAESPVLDAAARGELDVLLVVGDPLDPADTTPLEGLGAKLKTLVYVGPFAQLGALATLALPAAAWSEEDGTHVNFENRVQRVFRAHLPRGEGRPGWRVVADLAESTGVGLPRWTSAADVFDALSAQVPELAGMTLAGLGLLGAPGRAAAAAGRGA